MVEQHNQPEHTIQDSNQKPKIIIGITGASGSIYARELIKTIENSAELHVIFTENGKKVWNYELDNAPLPAQNLEIYNNNDLFSAPASGSARFDAMVIVPCSMGTMAKIANGISNNLLTRAADVMLKEKRKLIIVPRETPLNLIHLENMKKLILAGASITPASPGFYHKPKTINQLVKSVIQKIINLLNLQINLVNWE